MADTEYAPDPVAAEGVLRVLAEAFFATRQRLYERDRELAEGYVVYADEGFSLRENRFVHFSGKPGDDPDIFPLLGMIPFRRHQIAELTAEFEIMGETPGMALARITDKADYILAELQVNGKTVIQGKLHEK